MQQFKECVILEELEAVFKNKRIESTAHNSARRVQHRWKWCPTLNISLAPVLIISLALVLIISLALARGRSQ